MQLDGKIAVVTGAASGIGKRIAELFAQEGARIIAADINAAGAQETARTIADGGGQAKAVTVDISQAEQVERLIQQALDKYGQIDILVNDAALDQPVIPIAEMDIELWDKIMNVNVRGTFLCCRHVLPVMIAEGGGVIVNVASDLGYIVVPGLGAYCSSKGAVLQLTRVLAAENGSNNIRVNALCPTMVDTPMAKRAVSSAPDPDSWLKEITTGIPLGRIGTVQDVAEAALFLASDKATFITGVCLPIDGGRTVM